MHCCHDDTDTPGLRFRLNFGREVLPILRRKVSLLDGLELPRPGQLRIIGMGKSGRPVVRIVSIGEVLWDVIGDQEYLGGAALNFSRSRRTPRA